jgi:hypothetical protein
MTRFLYALTFAAGLWLLPASVEARPLEFGSEYHDPEREEREAEKRAERNGVILVGMIAAVVGGAALYQWGQEIRDTFAPLFRRRRPVVLVPVRDNYDDSDF